MVQVERYGNFQPTGKSKDKKQIILTHTSRNIEDYLKSISFRFNKKYNKIPNYLIDREGKIYNLISDLEYTKFFNEEKLNKNSVIISLENLGWLYKEPLKDYYVNWIGDIYNKKVYDKKWRDYFFWEPYTQKQIESTANLCKIIMKNMNIKKNIIGHNTKINGIENFEGLATRSNFDVEMTDLSPAFDFDYITKLIENE